MTPPPGHVLRLGLTDAGFWSGLWELCRTVQRPGEQLSAVLGPPLRRSRLDWGEAGELCERIGVEPLHLHQSLWVFGEPERPGEPWFEGDVFEQLSADLSQATYYLRPVAVRGLDWLLST